ncbi:MULTISPECIES: threonine--tRNA ligase [unclassified Campylobacter]|uniref:threonine--tRNA ligase n=1 Tax=unclassified Campylobacter TaxID=2593542 RepID=UPI001BDA5E49|nr:MULTISPECIES: threonine--tRNA ligase [unclassified Campylobacter]MBZ7977385.1 threonine--tRNA ligase [Campylobacter sp. RM12654]MBZ7990687.1 threonine--tRNA ligase [Campylobacter sp. RM9331]MBZ7992528.1 threonine--tRNA ligase [Campylobacter sp. RM9333]MBZ8005517.1 threonine--tRNA ligase [Campylobacter sp. RM9332]MBT0880304.1 threonine--tRNA ligase [Campylobacter sp. 2018MI27]
MEIIGYYDKDKNIYDTLSTDGAGLEPIFYDDSPMALEIIRHSCAHLLAEAITQLYKNAKFFVGPCVDEGFYYDFKVDEKISEEDLKVIEDKMKELAKKGSPMIKNTMSYEAACEKFKNDELKQAVLSRLSGEISTYSQGEFTDLCRGPHLPHTKMLKNFKLTKLAGAYLGGDEKNEMLVRIYGIAFATKEALKDYLTMIEEAKKRDHRKLGNDLKLFTFSEQIGGGLPLWLKNGARVRNKLEHILYKAHRVRFYEPVRGPELLNSSVWKTSGHYANYKENMYFTRIDEQEYGIKPMNCVGHVFCYKSEGRSYKDLPIKFFEYGMVHRHEMSGALHGLLRVREFTQDDSHIFCMPSQIKTLVKEILDFAKKIMVTFGFEWELEISTKPEKSIGSDEIWEVATKALMEALDEEGIKYGVDEGGGAFYGPKIDIKILDALKRKWQCGTIQVDFNLPERFELEYTDENNEKKRPVMLHRALLGSFERFLGILLEHTAGELPFFIAPIQVMILPVGEKHIEYSKALQKELLELGVDADINEKNDTLGKKIRNAEMLKVPYIAVIGDEEINNNQVALRDRRAKQQSTLTMEEFLKLIKEKQNEVVF